MTKWPALLVAVGSGWLAYQRYAQVQGSGQQPSSDGQFLLTFLVSFAAFGWFLAGLTA